VRLINFGTGGITLKTERPDQTSFIREVSFCMVLQVPGKTCTVAMILEDVINRGGIGLNFTEPDLLLRECEFLEKFRSRQRS